jgi:hypothetical protein
MNNEKYILAFFDDEEPLMEAVKAIRKSGTKIHEVYSPFPIHGIDDLLGYSRSRLPKAAFLFGTLGFTLGLTMQAYMLGFSKWRINIGGKPYLAWPDFVPVTFEATVLITALGMVGTFLLSSYYFPGAPALQPDLRVTSDRFCIAIKADNANHDAADIARNYGAIEIRNEEILL